jgi:hypothetical protein
MPVINAWAAVDDAVLSAFRDGRSRAASEITRMLPDLTRNEIHHALDSNAQAGRLASGEVTYQITPMGRDHLARTTMKVA